MCGGACNSPLYWFQRFMVPNVALQYLRSICKTVPAVLRAAPRARAPSAPVLFGAISLRVKDMTALCMRRANHENAAGPQEPKDDRPKVLGNQMQDGKSPCWQPQRQKCKHTSKACCYLPCLDARPFGSPGRWSHAGARHGYVVVNALAAASFAVKQAVVFSKVTAHV